MGRLYRKFLLLSIPFLLGFFLFYVFPFIYSLYYSVIESAFSYKFVGLDNYKAALNNEYFRLALKNTLEFAVTGVPVLVTLALALSMLLFSLGGRHRLLHGAFILPMLIPSAAIVPVVSQLFASAASPGASFAASVGMNAGQIARLPVYLLYVWKNVGFHMILLLAALSTIPPELNEAAALDGASGIRRFMSITLPLLSPTLFFVATLAVVHSLRIFKEAYLLYGAYPDKAMYLVQHYMNNHFYKLSYEKLASGAVIMAAAISALVALCYRVDQKRGAGV